MLWNGIIVGLIFGLITEGSVHLAMYLSRKLPEDIPLAKMPAVIAINLVFVGLMLAVLGIWEVGLVPLTPDPTFFLSWILTTVLIVFGIPAVLRWRR